MVRSLELIRVETLFLILQKFAHQMLSSLLSLGAKAQARILEEIEGTHHSNLHLIKVNLIPSNYQPKDSPQILTLIKTYWIQALKCKPSMFLFLQILYVLPQKIIFLVRTQNLYIVSIPSLSYLMKALLTILVEDFRNTSIKQKKN